MTFLLRFLPSLGPFAGILANPWFWLAFVLYSGALLAVGGWNGHAIGVAKYHKLLGENAKASLAYVQRVVTIAGEVRTVYLQADTQIVDRHHIIERESIHVPSRDHCNITAGWMRSHDAAAAASGHIEGAVDDRTDTGIAEARALAEIRANYTAFHQVANALRACRSYAGQTSQATP